MSNDLSRRPGRSKLRSSCDACGAAKLKCDRAQPECGRCVSHGITCVYGFSRKMGKPPGQRFRSNPTWTSPDQVEDNGIERSGDRTRGSNTALDLDTFTSVADAHTGWDAVNGNTIGDMASLDALDSLYGDLPGASNPPTCTSMNTSHWAVTEPSNNDLLSSNVQFEHLPTPDSSDLRNYLSNGPVMPQSVSKQAESAMSSAGGKGHNCLRAAHEILGHLSFLDPDKGHSSETFLAATKESAACRVSLDHVLSLNREASERLGRLITCSCARSPHLALLYASAVSQILVLYEQAAGCMQSIPQTPSPANDIFRTDGAKNTSVLSGSSDLVVAPSKMTIGTFSVDDLRTETALKIQLLSGEMRTTSRLIDQFMPYNSGGPESIDESDSGGIDSLYRSLKTWLRDEHARIINMMRSKLGELNR